MTLERGFSELDEWTSSMVRAHLEGAEESSGERERERLPDFEPWTIEAARIHFLAALLEATLEHQG